MMRREARWSWSATSSSPVQLAILYRYLHSFGVAILRDAHELTETEATQRGVAGLVAAAEHGSDLVVTRRHRPVAAVVGMSRLAELEEAAADLRDLALVLARAATDTGRRTSLDEVLEAFGHTRESLNALPDDE
jgi:prevent-host-death family protein